MKAASMSGGFNNQWGTSQCPSRSETHVAFLLQVMELIFFLSIRYFCTHPLLITVLIFMTHPSDLEINCSAHWYNCGPCNSGLRQKSCNPSKSCWHISLCGGSGRASCMVNHFCSFYNAVQNLSVCRHVHCSELHAWPKIWIVMNTGMLCKYNN